jgi:NAD(P)-dependent dehydrogenase (short-subunit alcohol dehydrogenase family)
MNAKTLFITGATAGIGRHAALELVRQGHHVIATGRRAHALAALAAEAKGLAGTLVTRVLDVTDEAAVKAAAAEVGPIDVLVNNAGYGQMGPMEEVTDAELRKQYDTNVFGLMNVTRAFLPQLRAMQGRIVNVGSIGGRVTFPLMGAYNSTKYAVESLSDALRCELAPFGVNVSIVEPGPIKTEFNDTAMATIDNGRLGGSPYGAVVAKAEEFRQRFEAQSAGPEVVTRAIAHAALAKRPRVRYVVPFSSSALLALLNALPTRWLDAVLRAVTGLTRKNVLAASSG